MFCAPVADCARRRMRVDFGHDLVRKVCNFTGSRAAAGCVHLESPPARLCSAHPSRTALDDGCVLILGMILSEKSATLRDHAPQRDAFTLNRLPLGYVLRTRRGLRSTTDAC